MVFATLHPFGIDENLALFLKKFITTWTKSSKTSKAIKNQTFMTQILALPSMKVKKRNRSLNKSCFLRERVWLYYLFSITLTLRISVLSVLSEFIARILTVCSFISIFANNFAFWALRNLSVINRFLARPMSGVLWFVELLEVTKI